MKAAIKIGLLTSALLVSSGIAEDADIQKELDALKAQISKLEKKQKKTDKKLSQVKVQSANDNVKLSVDYRVGWDSMHYDGYFYDNTGAKNTVDKQNPSLLTSRFYLDMAAAPTDNLVFKGRLAVYSTWGSHLFVDDAALKDWSGSSKASDTVMRLKEAYFLYSNEIGDQPIKFSVGRRPSTNGFLANYRENEANPGSPLAHITNMEVTAAMVMFQWDRFIDGAYTKFVYGRAHAGEHEDVYGDAAYGRTPYAYIDDISEDDPVDFLVIPGVAYNNGQYQIMYEWAHIFDTKGKNIATSTTKVAAGEADLYSIGLKIDGIGEEISDFLDNTTFFISGARTSYHANDGYSLIGSESGGSKSGASIWTGIIIPDMITEDGKLGFEYNQGSKYWTPMTWAEDTAIGSKIAVRGKAYEAYWNFNLFGEKYLPAQVRYTHVQHDYTPNINCAGWVAPQEADLKATDLRLTISYRY
jgi:hypothetical protein